MQVCAPPGLVWASWIPSRDTKLQVPSFGEKHLWHFSPILFPVKTDKTRLLLKTASDSAVLSKYGEIPEQIYEQSA
jgi:hypothetical protein